MSKYIYMVGTPDHAKGGGVIPLMALTSKADLIEWVRSSPVSTKKKLDWEYFRCENSIYGRDFVEINIKDKGEPHED